MGSSVASALFVLVIVGIVITVVVMAAMRVSEAKGAEGAKGAAGAPTSAPTFAPTAAPVLPTAEGAEAKGAKGGASAPTPVSVPTGMCVGFEVASPTALTSMMAVVVQLIVATAVHPDVGACTRSEELGRALRSLCDPLAPKNVRAALGATCSDPVKLDLFIEDFVEAICSAQPRFDDAGQLTHDTSCVGVRSKGTQTVRAVVSALLELMRSGVSFLCSISLADRETFVRSMLGIEGPQNPNGPKSPTSTAMSGLSGPSGLIFPAAVQPGQCRVVCSQLVTQMLDQIASADGSVRKVQGLPIVQSTIRKIADAVAAQMCATAGAGTVDGMQLTKLVVATAVGVFDAMCAFAGASAASAAASAASAAASQGLWLEHMRAMGPIGPMGPLGPMGPIGPEYTAAPSTLVPETSAPAPSSTNEPLRISLR
jgi:hypothetical protein